MKNINKTIIRGLAICIGLMLFSGLFPGVQAQDCVSALTITSDKNYVHTLVAREPIKDCLATGTKEQVQQSVAYVDGLGRPLQQVAVKASPGGQDWVTGMEYDGIGRARKQYLHFMDTLGDGGIYRTNWKSLLAKDLIGYFPAADTSKGYSEQILETSPRNRVSRVAAPGDTWSREKGEHLIVNNYLINTLADAIPNLYVEEDLIVDLGTYVEGELAGVRVRDENVGDKRGESITWTNKAGQTVMKMVKVMESGQVTYMRTLYIYDDFGNLRYVVQPQGMKLIEEGEETMASLSQSSFQGKWMFCYDYDRRNRMIRKRVPGSSWVSMVYDKRDRLVATQDGNQRERDEWLFTKYDRLNRPILTGITKVSQGSIIRSEAIEHYTNGADWGERHVGNARLMGYTNKSYPTFAAPGDTLNKNDLLTVTYYDNYDFTSEQPPSWALTSAKGQVTGTKVRVLGTDTWLTTVTFYDKRYRVIKTVSDNFMDGQDSVKLSYLNAISPLVTRQVSYHNGDKTAKVSEEFTYDHMDRLLTATHKINEGETVTLVTNEYDERGQLVKKKLGITETAGRVQAVDYEYNIRGWLTKINKGSDVSGDDKFAMELKYDDGPSPQYNGNIGQQIWKVPSGGDVYTGVQDYEYIYDAASRIKQAKYTGSGNYNVNNISYDHNGNILTLKRNSLDSLDYDYEGNQLTWVGDGKDAQQGFEDVQSAKGTAEYVYDSNGNMISDLNKGITDITYNLLNLPEKVTMSNGDVVIYTYDATGVKWHKSATTGGHTKTWDYNGGVHYTNQNIKFIQHSEGRAVQNGSTYDYEYNLTDHLGNVRVSVNAADSVIQRDDYYPFGLTFNHYQKDPPENHYKFQGQEHQPETGWDQYKWRNADPGLGRFFNIDPLAEDYLYNSPYAFSENRVIDGVELEGLEWQSVHNDPYMTWKLKQMESGEVSAQQAGEDMLSYSGNYFLGGVIGTASAIAGPLVVAEGSAMVSNPYAYWWLAFSNPATVETMLETGLDLFTPEGAPLNVRGGVEDIFGPNLNKAVGEWVGMQRSLANSKRQLNRFNTASVVFDPTSNSYFYGMNKGISISGSDIHPTLLEKLPEESLNSFKIGNCAECDAVNEALHGGASWDDLVLHTVGIGKDGSIFPKPQCENCQYTFKGLRSTSEQ